MLILLLVSPIDQLQEIFPDSYAEAEFYVEEHKAEMKKAADFFGNDFHLTTAVVFPEIVRFSYFRNFFETKALETIYLRYGSKAADFSIGRFQMKPSFVEKLEAYISNSSDLSAKLASITTYHSDHPAKIRSERISRLKSTEWQLLYLNAFVAVVDDKFGSPGFTNNEERVSFYACCYNFGFDFSEEEIKDRIPAKTFPYGNNHSNSLSYAETSASYYQLLTME